MVKIDLDHKIKSPEEVSEIIGPPPRETRVIMCHGTFDIVHPGHVRHLMYAKSKADVLVVSLTSDAFIEKANYRPYIPEDLRAINLAALQMVDYVVVDNQATPIKNIKTIRPDYFAKGYEYSVDGMPKKTQEELRALEEYGGQFIFTPGDVVFSSSSIIDHHPPNLAVERLMSLMSAENISFEDLHAALDKLAGLKAHVIGDTIIDSYVQTTLIGGNTKTPTFSVRYESQTDYVGGAGIVSKHLRAAGGDVTFTTVLGDDELKEFVINDLEAADVRVNALVDETRPTTNKKAFIANGYRLLKVDTLDNRNISDGLVKRIVESMRKTEADVIILSDFRHGIFSPATTQKLIAGIPDGVFRVADSQVASRWGNILDFQGFDLITPNEREARFSLGDQDSVVRPLGLQLYKRAQCKNLILKLGARGVISYQGIPKDEQDVRSFFVVDSFANNVLDAVGSGDALLAYGALVLQATDNLIMASIIGSIAAACECEFDGNIPVELPNVVEKLAQLESKTRFE